MIELLTNLGKFYFLFKIFEFVFRICCKKSFKTNKNKNKNKNKLSFGIVIGNYLECILVALDSKAKDIMKKQEKIRKKYKKQNTVNKKYTPSTSNIVSLSNYKNAKVSK